MTVVQNVYRGEAPSKYPRLARSSGFFQRYDTCEYVRGLVEQNFRDFIERALMQYDIDRYPVGVVGGFGYANRNIVGRSPNLRNPFLHNHPGPDRRSRRISFRKEIIMASPEMFRHKMLWKIQEQQNSPQGMTTLRRCHRRVAERDQH